jgi:hypothetical protein
MNEEQKITENKPDIPYIVFEGEMARSERHIKRLWTALIVCLTVIAINIVGFLWYLSQYDYTTVDYEQDGTGVNIVGDSNGVDYNGTESENTQENT